MENRIVINETQSPLSLISMGGRDYNGNLYEVDNISLLKNGKRILPIMGEFHYSRYEPQAWEEELLKMRSGGIQIVSTYVFWIHHEEKRGEWDFTGCRNLRLFLQTCDKAGMKVWLRIGPWAHGECRNGGFPDWVAHMDPDRVRVDDPLYLDAAEQLFRKLGEQCRDLMCKDGGPVIGIQIENEYGHCGGPSDTDRGLAHMCTLKRLAIQAGFDVPYYTATGWGSYVPKGEFLPVQGGYVDAPWASSTKEIPPSINFLFSPYKVDDNIGSDHGRMDAISYDVSGYPWLTAELGAGLQPTSHRRTTPSAGDIEAQAVCFVGSGVNLLGYYMYHGGMNPQGRYSTLQETQATDIYNNLPVKSYDFQACIRQSGELNGSYGRLKKLHLLLQDYGEVIAGAKAYFPEILPESAEDMRTIRMSVRRVPGGPGFLFLNNHQRKRQMQEHPDFSVEISTECDSFLLPRLSLKRDECAVIPFELQIGNTFLKSTNASLLCRLGNTAVFYSDLEMPEFIWEGEAGTTILLTNEQANRAFRFKDGLYITSFDQSCIVEQNGRKSLITQQEREEITIFHENAQISSLIVHAGVRPEIPVRISFCSMRIDTDGRPAYCEYGIETGFTEADRRELHQMYLNVDYLGDRAEVYQDGQLIDDWFTTGEPWHIALRRFGYPNALTIRVYPSDKPLPSTYGTEVYYDLPAEPGCEIRGISLIPEYRAVFG